MSTLKINERIVFLRKQKGITQEELAQVLNITNQSVSKWESGACCPDIQLLPEIASYFNVSIDELMGYKTADSFNSICLKIKALFEKSTPENCFDLAYKLAFLLAESTFLKGYIPWDKSKVRLADDDFYKWGYSACSEPEGNAAVKGNSVFISSNKRQHAITNTDIRDVYNNLSLFSDKNTIKVFFALYELTVNDFDLFVSKEKISEKSGLPLNTVEAALDKLPLQLCRNNESYRIDGAYMHFVPMLLMFAIK